MNRRYRRPGGAFLALAALLLGVAPALAQQVDTGVISLGPRSSGTPAPAVEPTPDQPFGSVRRGFDYEAFEARLEALWFQRKVFLADGRDGDAARQSEAIRAFCAEEGVRRLEGLAGALLAEAGRYIDEGHYAKALASIQLAETFDPGNPQMSVARATVYWKSGRGYVRAGTELLQALKRSLLQAASELGAINRVGFVLVIGLLGCVAIFSAIMLFRYQVPLRHEVQEWLAHRGAAHWSAAAGYGVLFLPFLIWFGAGWAALYWILITFRFMRRGERIAAVTLLIATSLALPGYRVGVALYGLSADPVVRNTLESADGAYDPDRIVKLQQLVRAHPEDPTYRFLLAGLYKNGRYFEEAFDQYKRIVQIDTGYHRAHINIGNIYYRTGQHTEAIAAYRKALEVKPDSVLAYYNMHIAQSELFHFEDAEQSLAQARESNPKLTGEIMAAARAESGTPVPVDAVVELVSVWQAALQGRTLRPDPELGSSGLTASRLLRKITNPLTVAALLTLVGCGLVLVRSGSVIPARRCIRCGRPFCVYCRTGRHGHEYCNQCLHLFVLGDGLAPETKTAKLYEVERHERRTRRTRKLLSLLLPGVSHLLRGRAGPGCVLLVLWFAALVAWQPGLLTWIERLTGLGVGLEMMEAGPVPAMFSINLVQVLGIGAALVTWFAANLQRGREV